MKTDKLYDSDRVSAARLQSDTAFLDLDGNLIDLSQLEEAERRHREHLEHFDQLPGADNAYRHRVYLKMYKLTNLKIYIFAATAIQFQY